ncbi:hypothetical protein Daus18300_013925 [Diaporthe australafricana]|uniref:Uncharacterized protein n=1 Tax=Diaporthe australafricana TaxID=127596 RepID=A0ABR3VXE3_9PEZI
MGFMKNAGPVGFIFFSIIVALFSTATAGFNIYTIVEAFKWLEDFVQLSGHGSNNWNWTVVILVLAFGALPSNGVVIACIYKSRNSEYRHHVILGLFAASLLHLGFTLPEWLAVRKYHWAEVLRE